MEEKKFKFGLRLQELSKWDKFNEVNERLDRGDTPNSVYNFIINNGFKIGKSLVYSYAEFRKDAIINNVNVQQFIDDTQALTDTTRIDTKQMSTKSKIQKLKSEIDALDQIIEKGYNSLATLDDKPIAPKIMMEAIKLKSELTGGSHQFLTKYGVQKLQEVQEGKYKVLMDHLISYIPLDQQEEAISHLSVLEDEYYRKTEYYEDYVNSLDISEAEKHHKLEEYFKNPPRITIS